MVLCLNCPVVGHVLQDIRGGIDLRPMFRAKNPETTMSLTTFNLSGSQLQDSSCGDFAWYGKQHKRRFALTVNVLQLHLSIFQSRCALSEWSVPVLQRRLRVPLPPLLIRCSQLDQRNWSVRRSLT